MKYSKILAGTLCLLVLSGCQVTGNDDDISISDPHHSVSEGNFVIEDTETAEIQQLIADFKEFSYSYILCKDVRFWVSSNSYITTEEVRENGEKYELKWNKVTDGDITTYQKLTDTLNSLCTDEMIDSLRYSLESSYSEKDDVLYLSENAGHDGGVMGSDIIYIHSLEPVANNTVTVNMISYGDLEYWGYETINEAIDQHSVQIKKVNGEWKIDQCNINDIGYIAWLYNSQYDNL